MNIDVNIRLYAFHGVMPLERIVGGWYTVNISVACDLSRAIESDDVGVTINYAELVAVAKREMSVPSNLIEHVAGRIAKSVLNEFDLADEVTVRLTKENPPMGANTTGASVTISIKKDKTI